MLFLNTSKILTRPHITLLQHILKHGRFFSRTITKPQSYVTQNIGTLTGFKRTYSKMPRTPDLIYFPQFMRWMKNKVKFKLLKTSWDPDFSEGAFIYGTTKAVCRVTEIIHKDNPRELANLLTYSAKVKLLDDMGSKLSKIQKKIIKLQPDDIKILVPLSVDLKKNGDNKNCRVAMRILALKWHDYMGALRLVLVALQTEFTRDYSTGVKPEWTISGFDVLECGMLTQTPT